VAVVVVPVAEDHGVLHPHQGLPELPPLGHEGLEERDLKGPRRVTHVDGRSWGKYSTDRTEGPAEKVFQAILGVALNPEGSGSLPHVVHAVGRIGPQHVRSGTIHQPGQVLVPGGVAAQEPVSAQLPQVSSIGPLLVLGSGASGTWSGSRCRREMGRPALLATESSRALTAALEDSTRSSRSARASGSRVAIPAKGSKVARRTSASCSSRSSTSTGTTCSGSRLFRRC
jgi:hypothetical protein